MNSLKSILYDPATAVSKSTAALLAMTAIDTTNLRATVTVPPHGKLGFRLGATLTGATTVATIALGVLNGATILGRRTPRDFPGTVSASTQTICCETDFVVEGLTPGSITVDAAYGVDVLVTSSALKYGGPNDTTTANSWNAFQFEIYDPQPLPTAAPGALNGLMISGANTGPWSVSGGVTFTNAGGNGLTLSSGIGCGMLVKGASAPAMQIGDGLGTQGLFIQGGTDQDAISVSANGNGTGVRFSGSGTGAGLAVAGGSTGIGATFFGGVTSGIGVKISNVSGDALVITAAGTGHGVNITGAGTGHGIKVLSGAGATADGINVAAQSTNGAGITVVGAGTGNGLKVSAGQTGIFNTDAVSFLGYGSGAGFTMTGGTTGPGAKFVGGSTSGDGVDVTTTSGDGVKVTPTAGNALVLTANGLSKHGAIITGGTSGTSDGIHAVAGTGGVDIRGAITGDRTGNLSGSVGSVTARVTANSDQIAGDATAATNLLKTTKVIGRGTVNTGATTTSVTTSTFTPTGAAANQFAGRTIIFDSDTATAALRGQQATISASTNAATPTFTVSVLTNAPASGDTFSVV